MAVDIIQLPPDGSGKKIASRSYTEGANTVYAQAGYITTDTASGNPAAVQNSAPSSEYGLVVRPIPSGVQTISGNQSAVSTTNWTSATSQNTANSISVTNLNTVTVAMHNTSTMTGGVLTFEVSPDNTNWFPIALARIDSYTVENTYTLSSVADRAWCTSVDGFTNFRVRLSTVITGTGTATVLVTAQTFAIEPIVSVGQANAASLNATVTQAGTWNIGTITTLPALPANQSVNAAQINGVTPLMGNGATGTGSQRVTIASDNTAFTVNAAQSGTWTVQPGNTANSTAWLTSPRPATAGGHTVYHLVSSATTNASSVKASAGQLYGWYITNTNAAIRYVKFHNTAGTPTAGASVYFVLGIPAGGAANVFSDHGIAFGTGIGITTVTGAADSDTVAVAANDLNINLFYT